MTVKQYASVAVFIVAFSVAMSFLLCAYDPTIKEDKLMKRRLKALDKYVIFSISMTVLYTVAEFITSTITGVEKTTLTACVYAFFAGEIVTAGLIKIFKIRGGD